MSQSPKSNNPNPHSDPAETHDSISLESVMANYLERIEAGEKPDPAEFLSAYPQHGEELQSFFRNHHWLGDSQPPEPNSLVGKQVGPYQIETEIARGGMGVVYRARQQGLQRPVALKLISSGILAGDEERKRFRIEAEAAARLDHPGIIAIHEIGSWEGHEYFSMTFVDGPTLQKRVTENQFNDQESARIVRDVARAVAYAHRAGIVHRDLKPDNILINTEGRPLVTDFGLAKWQRDGSLAGGGLTRTGQVLGTPHFMSPEQAAGRASGTASDVYSLGAILYALITGRPPHAGSSAAEVLRNVMQDEPETPRQIRKQVPVDLEKICLQAMRFEQDERYESADALADDLERFLSGEETRASGSGLIDRVAREIRRDQHQDHFADWGRTLYSIGGIVFVSHVVMYVLANFDFPRWATYWSPRAVMLGLIGAQIYYARGGSVLPRTVAERPVYSIWLGYLAALGVINIVLLIKGVDTSFLIPVAAALSGFGFVAMAGHVWGGSAIFGLGFFIIALLSAWLTGAAPVLFGSMWLVSLIALGQHYRLRGNTTSS